MVSYYFKIQIFRLQHGVAPIFHMSHDEFVERTDWLSDEELLDIVKIFREKANKFPQETANKRIRKISRATRKILALFRRVGEASPSRCENYTERMRIF